MTDDSVIEEAFKAHEGAPTWQDDPAGRDAAIRWHMRGFNDARVVFEKAHVPNAPDLTESDIPGEGMSHNAPTDDEREALHLIEQAESFREQTKADPDAQPNSMVGLWLRTASALEAALRRAAVQEPCEHEWQNRVSGGSKCAKCHLWQDKRVPQGEPSDEWEGRALRAEAALANVRDIHIATTQALSDTLSAAGVFGQEGEKR